MNVYDEIFDATTVSHALLGHFTSEKYDQLIAARTNVLSVYKTDHEKLVLLHEYKLHGRITGMVLVPQLRSPLDCLMISTGKAKLSLVRFDPNMPIWLETISLHYYEAQFSEKSILELAESSKLRIDPEKRCVFLFNTDMLAILPLTGHEDEDDDNQDHSHQAKKQKVGNDASRSLTGQSLVMRVSELHEDIKNVVDIQFLNSFNNPTLAILYQPRLAWTGNEKVVSKTPMKFMALTLQDNKSTTIYHMKGIPHDVHSIIPLTNSCVLVGVNEIMSVDNTGALQSTIQLNSFASKLPGSKQIDKSSLQVMFNEPVVWTSAMVSKDKEILIIMDHRADLYSVISQSEGRLLLDFTLVKLPIASDIFKAHYLPTCILPLSGGIQMKMCQFFIGFSSGNALMVKFNNLRSAFESNEIQAIELPHDEDEDYDALYGDDDDLARPAVENMTTVEASIPFSIDLMDFLINVGPITS